MIVQPELKEVYQFIDIEVEPRLEDAVVTLGEDVELAEAITYSRDSFAGKLKKFANENIEVKGTFSVSVENKLKIS
ncbi:hypothetical protein [Turicibacter sanguinis]|uniref:hypothetical protein n=1 Tax=Turicibacter sanguinis TaxID=154288 RepID=UPI0018A995D5|nr:hypothetical protein [Turicibacter sanguinis]